MTDPRRGVSRRGLLGILGQGFRELRASAHEAAPGAPPPARRTRVPRPAAEVREGVCDDHGRMQLDLRADPLPVGRSVRADAVGFVLPVVLVRVGDEHFAACATTCPCDGSDVLWSSQEDALWCPACGSRWRLDGAVLRGPAATGLRSFVVQEAEGDVRILPA